MIKLYCFTKSTVNFNHFYYYSAERLKCEKCRKKCILSDTLNVILTTFDYWQSATDDFFRQREKISFASSEKKMEYKLDTSFDSSELLVLYCIKQYFNVILSVWITVIFNPARVNFLFNVVAVCIEVFFQIVLTIKSILGITFFSMSY